MKNNRTETYIILTVVVVAALFSWYVSSLGLTRILTDQNAHLNLARQITDSMTPGISQIGFWPPLVHLVMMPFASVDWLYHTGLAGAFALIPFLALGSFFMYRLVLLFTKNRWLAVAGALLYGLNPYMLYYSVTPMMEVLFVSLLVGCAYTLALWFKTDKFRFLFWTGFLVTLASLARFEGLILFPLVAVVIAAHLLRRRASWSQIESSLIMFGFMAILGFLFILVYSWVYGGNPLAFINSQWSAFSQQQDYLLPTKGNVVESFRYLIHASYYMIGKLQVWLGLGAAVALVLVAPELEIVSISLVLFSPFLFDWLSLVRGNIVLYIWELAPYNWFYNERYGLYWIAFAIFVPLVLASRLVPSASPFRVRFSRPAFVAAARFVAVFFAIGMLTVGGTFLYQTAFADRYAVVRAAAERYPAWSELQIADALKQKYDYGKVFMTRATHDTVAVGAGIPLKNYIIESNYKYYDQAMARPWLFARWVVMYNTSSSGPTYIPSWSKTNEKISAVWGDSATFNRFYTVVTQNSYDSLYQINDAAVRQYAASRGFSIANIPSLNAGLTTWDADTVYAAMNANSYQYTSGQTETVATLTGSGGR